MKPQVVLVDEKDNQIGTAGKLDCHVSPRLHRAFSIFIFNSKGDLLIQQRSARKYHCTGLWSNTCCSHPESHQTLKEAARLRLRVEMGFETDLEEIDAFMYKAELDNGLTEYEFDHIFKGTWNGIPNFIQKKFLIISGLDYKT
ncbi:MAG TPA: isopentenyl-diphosphate delta-isomerase [Syntrophomonadaceae bacterium]|nr:isopentenyl-diphosphate delta-isomerase [Syntrophomonadaceae bacterium]